MGWTSILEINHDELAKIQADPQGWVDLLSCFLSHGGTGNITGGRIVAAFPRYDGELHREWEAFKKRAGAAVGTAPPEVPPG